MTLKILCKLGIHKWKNAGSSSAFSSNVVEKYYRCSRCGKRKHKVVPK